MGRKKYRNGDEIRLQATGCDSCSPIAINGLLCHEEGCPDAWRDYKVECVRCDREFYPTEAGQTVCRRHPEGR